MSLGIEALRKCELFDACDDALLEEVLAQGEERAYAAGDLLYAEEAEIDELYLVLEPRQLYRPRPPASSGSKPTAMRAAPPEFC